MNDVEKLLIESGKDRSARHPFRSRSAHTRRVTRWAQRLLEGHPEADRDTVLLAAVFHDVGYACVQEHGSHEAESAAILLRYAEENGIDTELAKKAAGCVVIHSEKDRMYRKGELTIEQLLLMEADLLDEEGALSVCWDGLSCGYVNVKSYREAFDWTRRHLDYKLGNPLVTSEGRAFWQEKAELLRLYAEQMERDLEEFR